MTSRSRATCGVPPLPAPSPRCNSRRRSNHTVVPAKALGHAHISEAPSDRDGVEVFETVFHGDWTWRLRGGIAVPAAEAADDPGRPSEIVRWMWVLKPLASRFDILIEGGERRDLVRIESEVDRLLAAAIPRLQELDSDNRGFGGDGDELEEPLGSGDLTVFEPEALGLENAEEL